MNMDGDRRELFIEGKQNDTLMKEQSKKHVEEAIGKIKDCDEFILIVGKGGNGSTMIQVSTLSGIVSFVDAINKTLMALRNAGLRIIQSNMKGTG